MAMDKVSDRVAGFSDYLPSPESEVPPLRNDDELTLAAVFANPNPATERV
jgi:hypothetical protein